MNRLASISKSRQFSSGRFVLPPIVGEPFKHYAPGSPERSDLEIALKRIKSEVIEIPCVVNGKEFFSGFLSVRFYIIMSNQFFHEGDTFYQTMPSNHGHKLAKVHRASPEIIQEAIKASQVARAGWASMPFEHRAMVFRKAADLIAG